MNIDGTGWIAQCNRWSGTAPDPGPNTGQYSVSILDAFGGVLASQNFDVVSDGAPLRYTSANLTLPFPSGAAQIVLSNAGTVIDSRTVSPNAPFVQLASLSGADPLDGTVTVAWNGSDPDGDALTYNLLYSTDGGATWMPIATKLTATSFDWDTTTAPGSKTDRLRVVASDGVNSSSATSDYSFAVVSKPPQIAIASPDDGSTLDPSEPVVLQALVYDLQDGEMTSGQVTWTSNCDGTLGSGFALLNPALSPGSQVITATSTNQNGMTTTASVSITVPVNPMAPRIDSMTPASAAPGTTVTINGANFDADAAYDTVLVGGVQAQVTAATASSLTVTLPPGLPAGPAQVTVSALGMTSVPFSLSIVVGPSVNISPSMLDFGSVTINQTKDLNLTAQNTGGASATISSGTFSNPLFAFAPGAMPVTVAAGKSATIAVRFSPTAAGDQTGTLTIAGATVNLKGTGIASVPSTYKLARIDVTRAVVDPVNWTASLAVAPGKQSLDAGQRNFQLGWEFTWPAGDNSNRNRMSALVTLTTVPATVTPGGTASLAATMVGDWYSSGGYGVQRDHTISLDGAAGSGQWSTVQDPNSYYHGSFNSSNNSAAPQPDSNGEVALVSNAKLNFGGDNWETAQIALVYTASGAGPATCQYLLASPTGSLGAGASNGSVGVSAQAGCQWASVIIDAPWLTLSSGINQTGSGNVTYAAQANTGTSSRSATLTIAGQTYTLTQAAGGAASSISVSPASVDFGSVTVNQTKDVNLTVTNTGGASATVSSGTFSNPAFAFAPGALPVTVGSGKSSTIAVRFSPTTAGDQSGSLTIAGATIALKGTGVAASSGASLTGAWQLTTTGCGFLANWSATLNLVEAANGALSGTVQNDPLNSTILPDGTGGWNNPTSMKSQHIGSSFGLILSPSGWISILQLSGTVSGSLITGKVTHYGSDDCASFTMVPASGGTGSAALSATPASLDFGSVPAGASKDLNLTLKNTGTAAATINSIASSNARFTVPTGASSVPAGGSVTITVRFTPADASSQTGNLTIASNAPTVTVRLTGSGGSPSISVSPASLAFGNVTVNTTSVPQTVTVANNGTANLTVGTIAPPAGYAVSPTALSQPIAPGGSATLQVTFTPTLLGAMPPLSLSIASNDTLHSPSTVTLTGSGVAVSVGTPAILAPASVNFSSVATGRTKSASVTLTNNGSATLHITSLTAGAPFSVVSPAVTSSSPLTIASKTSVPINLLFSPTAAGGQAGSLKIASDDPAHQPTLTVTLFGTGFNPANVLLSDSFNRSDATACSIGKADLFAGGSGTHYYLPVFPSPSGPIGANIVSGALQNNGLNFGGVQLTAAAAACTGGGNGEKLPQDLDIIVDLLVPSTSGLITEAGPYFRSRSAAPGDGIIGGTSSGYWVELYSTGEVKVYGLNPFGLIAAAVAPPSFDATLIHTLESAVQGANLKVTLDGSPVTFTQNGASTTVVAVSSSASNNGVVGISFGAEANAGKAGGQRAGNLVILSN